MMVLTIIGMGRIVIVKAVGIIGIMMAVMGMSIVMRGVVIVMRVDVMTVIAKIRIIY